MSDEIQAPVLESTNAAAPIEQAAPAPAVEKGASLDDTMAATMASIVSKRPTQGDDGKFIVKAGAVDATPKLEVPGQSQAGVPDPAKPVIEAPQSMPANVKALWATLPPDVQTYWAGREGEVHKKITSDGERLKNLEQYDAALSESREFIEQNRIPKPEYVRRLAVADQMLRTNPHAALAEIARMYGINPAAAPAIGQPMDPTIDALFQEVGQLKSTLTAQKEAERAAKLAETEKTVEAFKKDRPHFDKVESLMVTLYREDQSRDLATLYDMATNAHIETRKMIEAEKAEKAKADALEETKRKAAEAAKLAPFSRKPGSVAASGKPGANWEDTMKSEHQKIKARG